MAVFAKFFFPLFFFIAISMPFAFSASSLDVYSVSINEFVGSNSIEYPGDSTGLAFNATIMNTSEIQANKLHYYLKNAVTNEIIAEGNPGGNIPVNPSGSIVQFSFNTYPEFDKTKVYKVEVVAEQAPDEAVVSNNSDFGYVNFDLGRPISVPENPAVVSALVLIFAFIVLTQSNKKK